MICESCAFETTRLLVREWSLFSPSEWRLQNLPQAVIDILTEPVTHSLPRTWQGIYSLERAKQWIAERNQEGVPLLIVEKASGQAIGFIFLFELPLSPLQIEMRLGYALSHASWGKGFASELVEGLVVWCRTQSSISTIVGGVMIDNPASKRVLVKNGFQVSESEGTSDEEILRLTLRSF